MNNFPHYPKIVRIDRRPEILGVRDVVATEKIDGVHFRLFFPAGIRAPGEVRFGDRNEELRLGDLSCYGGRPAGFFRERPDLLLRMLDVIRARGLGDVTVFGEAYGSGIQKRVRYLLGNDVRFRAFDILLGDAFMTYARFVDTCDAMGLPRVPEIWRGAPSRATFDRLLERNSREAENNGIQLARNVGAGIVIRSNPRVYDELGQWLVVKHESARFAALDRDIGAIRKPAPERSIQLREDLQRRCARPG